MFATLSRSSSAGETLLSKPRPSARTTRTGDTSADRRAAMVHPYQTNGSLTCRCHSRCRVYPASKSTVFPSRGRRTPIGRTDPDRSQRRRQLRRAWGAPRRRRSANAASCISPPPATPVIVARRTRRFPTQMRRNPPPTRLPLAKRFARGEIVGGRMASVSRKPASRRPASSRRIVVVAVPPVDELDLVGPLQVFNSVNRLAGRAIYSIELVTSADRLTVEGEGGVLTFIARNHFTQVEGVCDSVLVVCGFGSRSIRDAALSKWLKKKAGEVRRLGAVCVGSFLLAEAGLLDGRRATTHWRFGRELASRHPGVRVEHEPLWVKDGNIYTSRGHLGGHRPRPRLGGGGLWRRSRPRGRARAGAVPPAAGRPAAGERLARLTGVRDDVDPRAADLDRRASRPEAVGRGSRGPDGDERAELRTRVHAGGGHHALPVRAPDARGGGAPPARAHGWWPQAAWPPRRDSGAST